MCDTDRVYQPRFDAFVMDSGFGIAKPLTKDGSNDCVMHSGNTEIPKGIMKDLSFDVKAAIRRSTAKAIDDFVYKTLDAVCSKTE